MASADPVIVGPTGETDWEAQWAAGIGRGERWDIEKPEPELVYELSKKVGGVLSELSKDAKSHRALVPGCGRGYAPAALGAAGFKTIGLELSSTAVATAQKECPNENTKYMAGDFFDATVPLGQFDLIFDSTFLCAIPPRTWQLWAQRMNELIVPGGFLVMQVFPISVEADAPEIAVDAIGYDEPGPPFRLTLKLIRDLLSPYPFDEVVFRETPKERWARGQFLVRQEPVREYFMIWKKKAPVRVS